MDRVDFKVVLKTLWKKSKISALLLLLTVAIVWFLGVLRLGRFPYLRKVLKRKATTQWNPDEKDTELFRFSAELAGRMFTLNNRRHLIAMYKNYNNHSVRQFKDVKFCSFRKDNKVYVGIRGSNNVNNWIDNFRGTLEYDRDTDMNIHTGYQSLANGIYEMLKEQVTKKDIIYITGASLGGAVAIALGLNLKANNYNVVKVHSFANPKITDNSYKDLDVLSVHNSADVVPYVPVWLPATRYKHAGECLVLEDGEWLLYKDNWASRALQSLWLLRSKLSLAEHSNYLKHIVRLLTEVSKIK